MTKVFATSVLFIVLPLAACGEVGDRSDNSPVARNIILFIGDGMGVTTVTAARIFDGQSKGMRGEENTLSFERFPNVALVKTYNTNQQVPDSAGTTTAMLTGEKTRAGVINVGPEAQRGSCEGELAYPLTTITELAKQKGKAVGFATTTRVTHATPASVYARTSERDWEDDSFISPEDRQRGCRDIAHQLVNYDGGIDIAMGGGGEHFFGSERFGKRVRPDDDLVREWLAGAPDRRYITSAEQLDTLEAGDQVLGLFAQSHMSFIAERPADTTEPTLTDMTRAAIRLLSANDNGFFLLVEGGRIDHGHHDGKPGYALLETQEFANAVQAALEMIDLQETLVLVTADHSHTLSLGGYPTRGNPILGLVVGNDANGEPNPGPTLAHDGQPFTALAYANGPGAVRTLPRPTPDTGLDAMPQALVPVFHANHDGTFELDETHGGEDVALYGTGAGSETVRGVIEQDRIYDIMMSAFGWDASP